MMMAPDSPPNVLKAKLLAMMVLRVVIALAFLGITTWFQTRTYSYNQLNLYPLYAVVVTVGLLTIAYALALNSVRNLRLFTFVQVTVDIALVTVIVFVTGGTESYLHTLYLLSIIGGSILLNRKGGYYAASVSSIAYGVLIDMDFYGMLPVRYKVLSYFPSPAWKDVLTTVATNILAYFTVAYLTGYLAERTVRAEKELEAKEIDFERLEVLNRHIIENITSGIMTLDDSLRVTSFNRAAETVTGYTLKDVYYRPVYYIFPDMIEEGSSAPPAGMRLEKKFRRKDGKEIFLGFMISQGQGRDASYIVIFQDLTQVKVLEEQLRRDEKLKALGELSIGIAHEIRNPLASISGSIQVLKNDLDLDGEDSRLMEIVLRETERLNLLITDYLLFAKPANEKRERVDIGAVTGETVKVFSNSPEAANLEIRCEIKNGIFVLGDARQLGQVFWNLFLNAAHAMPGGGDLTVSSRIISADVKKNAADPALYVEIRVADTGEGIKPEYLGRVFDPFFSTKDSGTGLGLAIVHRIIESHGGSIDVKSGIGKGSVFRITLPLSESELPH